MTEDEAAMRSRTGEALWRLLRDAGDLLASGEGDLLVVWPDFYDRPVWAPYVRGDLDQRLRWAEELYEALARRPRREETGS